MASSDTGRRPTALDPLDDPVARSVWQSRYAWRDGDRFHDADVGATWRRVAAAAAGVEDDGGEWTERFRELLSDFRFLPGGRILAGAGTGREVTLFNCFVMGNIEDSLEGIFESLREGAVTMQQGGGVGYDFSTLRPRGSRARRTGAIASGPVSFMRVWDAACATVLSTGARRGAMMATLRCDHPDIEDFVDAKSQSGELTRFNLSVQITDAFMEALQRDEDWPLVFPETALDGDGGECVERRWPGRDGPVSCRVVRRLPARELWDRIMRATYEHAEPGVLFVDRVNEWNNLHYREHITATNPCGEVPLPPYGACDLGSINLTRFVRGPFEPDAELDLDAVAAIVPAAVRLLDNVVDISGYPVPEQAAAERDSRRIGLGVTGLADALAMLGVRYDSPRGRGLAEDVMRTVCRAAYRASIALAREKGPFPGFETEAYLSGRFVRALPDDITDGIRRWGIRNSHLTAIAPTGTISLFAGNVSSSLEPIFSLGYQRRMRDGAGEPSDHRVTDYAWRLWLARGGDPESPPEAFVTAHELDPEAHLQMQAALQPHVDNAISKTVNIPEDHPFEDFRAVYERAWEMGLKGCTTFRPNRVTGAVMGLDEGREGVHCCSLEREPD